MGLFIGDWWSEPEGGGATPEFIPLWGNLGADPMIIMSFFEEIVIRHKCQSISGLRTQCDTSHCIIRELYLNLILSFKNNVK